MRPYVQLTLVSLILAATVPCFAADLPYCEVRTWGNKGPAIFVDGQPFSPLMFVGNNQFNRDEVLIEQMRMARDAGFKLFGFNVRLDGHGSAEKAAEVIDKFCSAVPEGYFYVRIWLGPNKGWLEEHPDQCIMKYPEDPDAPPPSYRLNLASPASRPWREDTAQRLRTRIEEMLSGPHAGRFMGVGLEYLQTAEWFYPEANEFMDYSPANLEGFRAWLKAEYRSKRRLRKAWGDTEVTFDTAEFPTPEEREATGWGPFRDPAKHQPAIDMQRYQNDLIPETIAYFAKVVKEASHRKWLVGAFYGYTMELNNNGPRALVHSGHLGLAKLLECNDIDILMAPHSYFERAMGQPGHLHQPVDSIGLHGKLVINEEDMYTHLATKPEGHLIAPGWKDQTKDLSETCHAVRRDFGTFLTHGAGMSIFDLLSDGRWNEPAFWSSAKLLVRMAAEIRSEKPFSPEVAFVASESTPHCMVPSTYPVLLHSLSWWRSELDRLGAPVGYYIQSDIGRLPETVKVIVLANPFALSPQESEAIQHHLADGKTVIWTYAPGISGPDGVFVQNITDTTGITVEAKADKTPMFIKSALTDELSRIDSTSWKPRFVVTDTEVDVVARYAETDEVCAAAKPVGGGVSLYTAVPRLPVGLLREVCRRAGVHFYRDTPGMVGVAGPYLFAHTSELAEQTFRWPVRCREVRRVVPPAAWPMRLADEQSRTWNDILPENTTVIYRCEPAR